MRLDDRFQGFVGERDARRKFFREIRDGSRILDLGCGEGKCAREISSLHTTIEIFGVDVIDQSRVPSFIKYTNHDINITPIPYSDNQFDAVIMVHVLEHLTNWSALAREINRVLKANGKLYVETPNWTTLFVPSIGVYRGQHQTFNFFDDPTHIKPWSKQGLFEFIQSGCDLQVKKTGTVRNWLRISFDPFIMIVGLIWKRRDLMVTAFWNLYGWRIYGIGCKEKD